jgi:hypothetical protein
MRQPVTVKQMFFIEINAPPPNGLQGASAQ